MKNLLFSSLRGYKFRWLRHDFMAALVVTAIAIPQSLGYAAIVGLPVQTGLYCALLAPIVFAALSSTKRLVVGADSATAALVASGAAAIALTGSSDYANAVAILGIITAVVLIAMSAAKFGFLADLISHTVFLGFISGIGVQLLIGKLPEMLGLTFNGSLFDKIVFVITHLSQIEISSTVLSLFVVIVVIAGWKFNWPGALIGLLLTIAATKLFGLHTLGIEVIGTVPQGLPSFYIPNFNLNIITTLLPTAFSIAIVILAQSLAITRNVASRHEEKLKDNQDIMALGFSNFASAILGGFAINGSPPRTSAGEMAGGRSQLINVIMAIFIGITLIIASGLLYYMPVASLAAIVFTIGLHLLKVSELKRIWGIRKSEFGIAILTLVCVAILGAQKGLIIAVVISIVDRLRRQYHPNDEILLRDKVYSKWAEVRLSRGRKHKVEAPKGLLIYKFNEAIFFENAAYFLKRVNKAIKGAKDSIEYFVLDASAITDIDYTAAKTFERLCAQLSADNIQFGIAHVHPHLQTLLNRYQITNLIGKDNIFPGLRFAVRAYTKNHISSIDQIRALKLSPSDYIVIGGAVLEILGIRQTHDVDLVVNKKTYDRLNSRSWKEYVHDDGKKILSRSGYKVMLSWVGKDLGYFQQSALWVDGIPLMSLEELIECKSQLGRQKDLRDIVSIKEYLRKQESKKEITLSAKPAFVKAF